MRRAATWMLTATMLSGAVPSSAPWSAATTAAQTSQPASVRATRMALDRYLRGDYRGALQGPPILARFDTAEAERWVAAGGAAAADRRRLAAALLALEYAGLRPSMLPALLTWARDALGRQRPTPTEALWLRASVGLAEGLDRWVFLVHGVPAVPARGRQTAAAPPPVGHIAYARARFPDDPHFRMAEAVAAELLASRPIDVRASPEGAETGWDQIAADMLEAGGPRLAERTATLHRAAELLGPLTSSPALAAEAHLRLGYVRLRQDQRDAALQHFDQLITLTNDPRLRFLGHFYSAWALGSVSRVDEAAFAYRAALRLAPGARSASALLVSLLLRDHRLDEAERAANEFLTSNAPDDDPWRTYFIGDFEAYPALVSTLREAIR